MNHKQEVKNNMKHYCTPYSKLRKAELVNYITKFQSTQMSINSLERLKVPQLKAMAKDLKESRCKPPFSKLKKKNVENYFIKYLKKPSVKTPSNPRSSTPLSVAYVSPVNNQHEPEYVSSTPLNVAYVTPVNNQPEPEYVSSTPLNVAYVTPVNNQQRPAKRRKMGGLTNRPQAKHNLMLNNKSRIKKRRKTGGLTNRPQAKRKFSKFRGGGG